MTPRKPAGRPKRAAARTNAHKLWGGRFTAGPHPALDAVNRSIDVDLRLWPFDIRLSQAWARALGRAGVLASGEARRLVKALEHLKCAGSVDAAQAAP